MTLVAGGSQELPAIRILAHLLDHETGGLLPYGSRAQSKASHLEMRKLKEEFFKILPPTIFFFIALDIVMFIRV